MRAFKRAWISVTRRLGQTFILFLIMFILGSMVSGVISVSRAIQATEINLLRRIPPVATIWQDVAAISEHINLYGESPVLEWPTPEIFEAIGTLPQVRAFNYSFHGYHFYSEELVLPIDISLYQNIPGLEEEILLIHLLDGSLRQEGLEHFILKGVYNSLLIDFEEGVVELVSGRTFTVEEVNQSKPVVILSETFARANNLYVGDFFQLEIRIYETFDSFSGRFFGDFSPELDPVLSVPIELEVIGLFVPTMEMDEEANLVNFFNHVELNRRFYVPMGIAKSSRYLFLDYVRAFHPEQFDTFNNFGAFYYENVLFQLYDSLDLIYFNEFAQDLLPDFWFIHDLTYEFSSISNSMSGMQEIVNGMVWGLIISALVIVGLIGTLFLYDRRHEIGIYFSLGESRRQVIIQIFLELFMISLISLTVALFVGHLFAEHLTYSMLQNEIINNPNVFINQDFLSPFNDFNQMGFATHLTAEEMVEAFNVSLDPFTILVFYGSGMGVIMLSIVFPILYLSCLKPKKLLL